MEKVNSFNIYKSLTNLYINSFYNLPQKREKGTKLKGKEVAKIIGIAFLAIYIIGVFGFLFFYSNISMYKAYKSLGMEYLLIINTTIMATMLTLIFGFIYAMSTYYMNDMELQLLSMPIPSKVLLASKFSAVYITEALVSLLLMILALVVFAIHEKLSIMFYVYGILISLFIPLIPLSLSYLIQIPLMSFTRFLRNKKTVMILSGIIGIAIALVFNVFTQKTMLSIEAGTIDISNSSLIKIGSFYPPSYFAMNALMNASNIKGLLYSLLTIAICILCAVFVILVFAKQYSVSLLSFNESHIKKLSKSESSAFLKGSFRFENSFFSMLKREINMMNREPVYLLNGPLIIPLLPIIYIVMFLSMKESMGNVSETISRMQQMYSSFKVVVVSLFCMFLSSSTNITSTSVSRDAKFLPYLKSLPIDTNKLFLAKLVHGIVFVILGSLEGVILGGIFLKLDIVNILLALFTSFALSSFLNLLGLWLDTINPRLKWDTTTAAMKQNPNTLIATLGGMAVIAIVGFVVLTFKISTISFVLFFGLIPAILFVVLLPIYLKIANKMFINTDF